MRKEIGLILAGALCFDLGLVIIPNNARSAGGESGQPLKFSQSDLKAYNACVANKGIVSEYNGQKFCTQRTQTMTYPQANPKR